MDFYKHLELIIFQGHARYVVVVQYYVDKVVAYQNYLSTSSIGNILCHVRSKQRIWFSLEMGEITGSNLLFICDFLVML